MKIQFLGAIAGLVGLVGACQAVDTSTDVTADVASPDWPHGAMVAAADARAVEAAVDVLENGGSAVDAAIAAHAVLGLVEPQSSGIGGGAFMVYFDRASGDISVFDGRETAPASADANLFVKDGEVLGFIDAWQSGRSVGVPSVVALYGAAYDAAGTAEWSSLFDHAIDLAANGWTVTPRLAGALGNERLRMFTRLDDHPVSAAYFYPEGEPLAIGDVVYNPDYAATLIAIAEQGMPGFYNEEVAGKIVAALQEDPIPGALSVEDILSYDVVMRDPLCGAWRDKTICSAPPPSSGGVVQNMIPGLYDRLVPEEASDADQLKAFVDAQRLTYADRDHYVADGDHVPVPADQLINPAYLDARAGDVFAPDATPTPGDPGVVLGTGALIDMWGRDQTHDAPGTTHLSIVDFDGNAVSMTATVESAFGNARMVNGFLLNNELTDFSRNPEKNGKPVANAPGPTKRPRSSMSPTILLDENGELLMVTGSPGGNSIVAYVAKTIVGVFDWGLTPQEATDFPNIIARGLQVGVEIDRDGGPEAAATLRDFGYLVQEREGENSGLHVILVTGDGLEGAADPRREGVVVALPGDTE